MFMQEAKVSREIEERNQDVTDFSTRDKWREQCQRDNDEFKRLTHLRNALVHGVRSSDQKAHESLSDEVALKKTLAGLRKNLFVANSLP